ncbi:RND transporter [Methylosinus sp. R-45379]|uniref:TolC family protein n=1 Tax=Methylosinus sp. R-45379 TaxID=980563 RepID=UPI0007C8AD4C|nr:TolC family protein [Methylosinus sp. R-45379]OAI27842.1 RND transporter [Methylosinus sp. R-45379]
MKRAAIVMSLLVVGCRELDVTPPSPTVVAPSSFDETSSIGAPSASPDLAHWWTVWRDPLLDRLIDEALAGNPDLRIAKARVEEARALVTVAESTLYPTLGADAGLWEADVKWRNPVVDFIPGKARRVDAHIGGLAASWEPDIFGGRSYDAEAARANAAGVEEQSNGARMIVVSEAAQNYQDAKGLQRRLLVLDHSVETLGKLLRYVEARYQAGQALAFDVTLVRERLETQRSKRPDLLSALETRQRRLAVLTGRPPEPPIPLPAPGPFFIPLPPRGQLPSEVLERRPDVRARIDAVRARVASLTSAKTDLLPRFQIEFLGQDGRLHFQGIPGLQGTGGLVGLTAHLPIFTAGRIEANIAASDARLEAAVADYDKSVLHALEDVENAYGRRRGLDRRSEHLYVALVGARRNHQISRGLYEGGRKTFGDVLNAELDVFERENDLLETQMAQSAMTIQLYRSLGGGW